MKLNLNLNALSDIYIRQNFQQLQDYINTLSAVIQLSFISTKITVSDTKIAHNLGFTPVDLIQTSFASSTLTITWHYEKFDKKYIYFTVNNAPSVGDTTKYNLNILVGRLG